MIPGVELKAIYKKMLANFAWSPIAISVTFSSVALLAGGTLTDARQKIQNDLPKTVAMGSLNFLLLTNFLFLFMFGYSNRSNVLASS